jgi:ketosteroid isomerase-like protein
MRRKTISTAVALFVIITFTTQIKAQGKGQDAAKPGQHDTRISNAVRAVLDTQAAAWNRGDIDGFMDGYARSVDTVFVSGDSVTHGWQTVLDRYKKGYDSREKMGTLTFSDLEINPMAKDVAVVLGSWRLKRVNDEPHGRFTLIFRKTKVGWKIVHDHTSSAG